MAKNKRTYKPQEKSNDRRSKVMRANQIILIIFSIILILSMVLSLTRF